LNASPGAEDREEVTTEEDDEVTQVFSNWRGWERIETDNKGDQGLSGSDAFVFVLVLELALALALAWALSLINCGFETLLECNCSMLSAAKDFANRNCLFA
jgi:hypothetical protein